VAKLQDKRAKEEETEERGAGPDHMGQRKGGNLRGPPMARITGQLGYRVLPAAMSRDLIASRACDYVTCSVRNRED
jgi:hypothetical protein